MLNDLSLRGIAATELSRPLPRPPAPAADSGAPAGVTGVLPNPRLRLDSGLGMVVIEFLDAAGEVENSLPTKREIAAYRAAAIADQPLPSELGLPGLPPLPRARDTRDMPAASAQKTGSASQGHADGVPPAAAARVMRL
ncbi:MAG TPA: hypothetical protein VGM87_16505 [Roseomonas sp.]|jgi:hypothetical protein